MEAWENNLLRHSFSFILIVVTKKRYYLLFSPLFSLARQSHLERKRKKSIGKGKERDMLLEETSWNVQEGKRWGTRRAKSGEHDVRCSGGGLRDSRHVGDSRWSGGFKVQWRDLPQKVMKPGKWAFPQPLSQRLKSPFSVLWVANPDAVKDWGQEKGATEDEMVGWHHRLNGHKFEQTLGDSEGQGGQTLQSIWWQRVRHDLATEQQQRPIGLIRM